MTTIEKRIRIESDAGIISARAAAWSAAQEAGFDSFDRVLIATAVSEVVRNILEYARLGEVVVATVQQGDQRGVMVVARDTGPGIADVAQAMKGGYSTGRGLGLGLSGARRLMDEFEISSQAGSGTTVTMKKWLR